MTSLTWMLVTSLLLSLMVSLAVSCNKISNGNWMKKLEAAEGEEEDIRTAADQTNGWFKRPDRTQGNGRMRRQARR